MVTQDTSLLHRSVRDNIRYGRPEASEAEMVEAARRAEAHDFIARARRSRTGRTGYDAHVGERGVKLSGGQRQRIAIARVILKDAPILVLDEATSALDSRGRGRDPGHALRLMQGKTVIAIAHRLSTIAAHGPARRAGRGPDRRGGHARGSCCARGGLYARLWKRQSGGFIDCAPAAGSASHDSAAGSCATCAAALST